MWRAPPKQRRCTEDSSRMGEGRFLKPARSRVRRSPPASCFWQHLCFTTRVCVSPGPSVTAKLRIPLASQARSTWKDGRILRVPFFFLAANYICSGDALPGSICMYGPPPFETGFPAIGMCQVNRRCPLTYIHSYCVQVCLYL